MATAEEHKSNGVGKDVDRLPLHPGPGRDSVRDRLSGHQRVTNVRAHADRGDRRGCARASVFHASVGESRVSCGLS